MTIENIIVEFKQELFRFVQKYIKDESTAKDVHQEILIKIFTHHHNLKNKDSLKSWVYQIARNSINDYFRKNKIRFSEINENITDIEVVQPKDDELLSCIKPFINQLRPSYKQAIEFTDIEENTQKALAEKLNISYSGAKSTVQRARHKLKELFSQCCEIEADKYGNILSLAKKEGCSCP